jgi:type II secretion system protein N
MVTFPFAALQSRLLSEITLATGVQVRAAEWSVGFPVAIEWHDLVFSKQGVAAVSVESMRIGIGLLAQLNGRATLDAVIHFPGSAQPNAAQATGTITGLSWSFQGPTMLKSRLQQVDLSQLLKPYVVKGFLRADISQHWVGNPGGSVTFKGDGSWKTEVKDLVLERIPIGSAQLSSLTFSRVTLDITCRDAQCDITDFKGEGPDGSITGQGRLQLQQPLQQTTLELTLTVLAGSGWAQKSAGLPIPPLLPGTPLTFKVIGSVANPRLSV